MSNTKHITENLSAYLDNELSKSERARVEAHLRTCAQCQRDLAALRYTIQTMRELPPMRAPRSFTLSDAQARRVRGSGWLVNALRGMTALAALLLIVTVSADLFLLRGASRAAAPASAPQSAMAAPTVAPAESNTQTTDQAKSAPTSAPAAGAAAPTATPQPTQTTRAANPPAAATSSATTREPSTAGVGGTATPTATATPAPTATATYTLPPTATSTASPTATRAPTPTPQPTSAPAAQPTDSNMGLRLIELGLLGVFILGVVSLFALRLSAR